MEAITPTPPPRQFGYKPKGAAAASSRNLLDPKEAGADDDTGGMKEDRSTTVQQLYAVSRHTSSGALNEGSNDRSSRSDTTEESDSKSNIATKGGYRVSRIVLDAPEDDDDNEGETPVATSAESSAAASGRSEGSANAALPKPSALPKPARDSQIGALLDGVRDAVGGAIEAVTRGGGGSDSAAPRSSGRRVSFGAAQDTGGDRASSVDDDGAGDEFRELHELLGALSKELKASRADVKRLEARVGALEGEQKRMGLKNESMQRELTDTRIALSQLEGPRKRPWFSLFLGSGDSRIKM